MNTKMTKMYAAIIAAGFMSNAGCDGEKTIATDTTYVGLSNQIDSNTVQRDGYGKDELKVILNNKIVDWKNGELLAAVGEDDKFSIDDNFSIYKNEKNDRNDNFTFSEIRPNGKSVYKNSNHETIKFDDSLGYWEFIGNEKVDYGEMTSYITSEDAKSKFESMLNRINIAKNEIGSILVKNIGVSTEEEEHLQIGKVVARHVRINRKINNARVLDSHVMATYGLDGEPTNIEIRWPKFDIKQTCNIVDRGKVIDRLVNNSFADLTTVVEDTIVSQVLYEYDRENKYHIPVIHIRFANGNADSNELFETMCNE